MIIGVPREIKRDEYRVGLLPIGAEEMTRAGHQVLVEAGAGLGSGLSDQHVRPMQRDPPLGAADRQPRPAASGRPVPPISRAINIDNGEVTNRAVAETFEMPYNPRFEV